VAQKLNLNPNLIWPLVILIIAFGAFFTKPWQTKPLETISVSAQGKAQVKPNVAKFTATVETQNQSLDQARSANQQKVSTLVTKLKSQGIEDKDIKTQNISGGPGYEAQTLIYPVPRTTTNQVSTTIEVTVRNFDIADSVLATLTQNGASNIYGPSLTVDDSTLEEVKAKARDDAVEDARKKADQLAKASDRKVGKVIKIQEQGDFGYPIPILAQGGEDLKRQASQIQPGQNEVTINLQVDFSIK